MSFIGTVSYRHLRSPNPNSFTSFASGLSIIGLSIGIAALIITMSVLNGFEKTLSQKLISFNGHIQVQHILGHSIPSEPPGLSDYVNSYEKSIKTIPYIRKPVLIREGQKIQSVLLDGIPQAETSSKLEPLLIKGSSKLGKGVCVLGKKLTEELEVSLGDKIVISQMNSFAGNMNNSAMKQLKIGGIFHSGITEYDRSMVYVSITEAEQFFSYSDKIDGFSIYLTDSEAVQTESNELFSYLGYPYFVTTWKENHRNLYDWMSIQQWPILIIFSMIALVGIINIISAISMIILEKIKEIGLLKALGCTRNRIQLIFLMDGVFIGFSGTTFGGLLGLGLTWAQSRYQMISIPEDVYFMDRIPVIVSWDYFAFICFFSVLVTLLASTIPTHFAGKINPAEAVRYE